MGSAILKNSRGISIDEVVDSYWVFLARNKYDAHLHRFKQRLTSGSKAAAEAEAVVFSFLWSSRVRPDIFEDISTGGPDFICQPNEKDKFLVEVTSLESGAVARRSTLPDKIDGRGGGAFGLITENLRRAVGAKAFQLANYPHPRVLAIASSHVFATILMDALPAQNLLISDPMISYRIGDPTGRATQVTDLQRSAFLRTDKSRTKIVPCRQSISAILLVAMCWNQAHIVGILHPEPVVAFDPELLRQVPYVRLKNWPITNGSLEPEWIESAENPAVFHYGRIR